MTFLGVRHSTNVGWISFGYTYPIARLMLYKSFFIKTIIQGWTIDFKKKTVVDFGHAFCPGLVPLLSSVLAHTLFFIS